MYKVECRKLIASPFFLLSVIALYFVILLGIRDFYPENEISSMLETGMGRIGLTSLPFLTTMPTAWFASEETICTHYYQLIRSNLKSFINGKLISSLLSSILIVLSSTFIYTLTMILTGHPIGDGRFSYEGTNLLLLKHLVENAWVITMLNSLLWMTTLGIVYLTISLYSNSSLSLFVIGIFYVLEILRNGIGFFPYEFTVLNIILFYFNFFFLRMWIILETATSSSISIPTCQYSLLFYSIILALSIILGLKWTKKFDFQLKNIFTTSY